VRSHRGGYGRRTCELPTSFWTFTRFRRKKGKYSTGLFPELTLEELVFQCHE
jgi:hypothetical protein